MTDDELSRLLDEYALECSRHNEYDNSRNVRETRATILAYFERRKSGEGGEDASDSFADAVLDSFRPEWRNCPEGYSHTAHQQAVIWKRNRMRAALHAARTERK